MSLAILSVGRDPQLLNTRNRFLANAGFNIISATTMPQILNLVFEEKFDAALLCNSIQGEDRRMLAGIIARYYPAIPILLISDPSSARPGYGTMITSGNLNNIVACLHQALRPPVSNKRAGMARIA